MCHSKDFIILDIESLGFYGVSNIILIGIAKISENKLNIYQYLARNVEEEIAILMAFLSHINENSVFLTFNGSSFDIPLINKKLKYYGLKEPLDNLSYDLYYFSKRVWNKLLPNLMLNTIEKYIFGIERENDMPSFLVPKFYNSYVNNSNVGPLIPIIKHNKLDLILTAKIFSKLHKEWKNL